jgi:hypothetical protein
MFNELPKDCNNVFGANQDAMRKSYGLQRRRMAAKLEPKATADLVSNFQTLEGHH